MQNVSQSTRWLCISYRKHSLGEEGRLMLDSPTENKMMEWGIQAAEVAMQEHKKKCALAVSSVTGKKMSGLGAVMLNCQYINCL